MNSNKEAADAAAERIRALNDEFRTSLRGGSIMITAGIIARGGEFQMKVLQAVKTYAAFDTENDPYGEHDFGAVDVDGVKVFFKIDYYDGALTGGSPDPGNPTVTERVMTIMLAEEY